MHILIVTHVDDPFDPAGVHRFGGGGTFVFDLGRYLVRHGHRISYVCRRNDREKSPHERPGPLCDIYRPTSGPLEDLSPADQGAHLEEFIAAVLALSCRVPQIDVVHSHYWTSGLAARALIEKHPVRHVHNVLSMARQRKLHGEEERPLDQERQRVEVKVFQEADLLVACCPAELRDLLHLYPEVRHERIAVIPYGLDLDKFFPRPQCSTDLVRRASRRFAEGASTLS